MVDDIGLKFELQSDQLFIHFDVSEHYLKLETFIQTATHAKGVIQALNKELFDGKLKYDLIVVPPEQGTFLTKLATWVGIGWAIIQILETDIAKGFVVGLTDKEPRQWVEETTKKYVTKIANADEEEKEDLQKEIECKAVARIITHITKSVLEKENSELKRIGITGSNFPDLLKARNEFYEACIADQKIKAIGFSEDDDFPIPRRSFPERAIKVNREEKEDDNPWEVSIESIFVSSPNWDKDDQSSRQWKGKDSIRRECYFIIVDEDFWRHVKLKDLHVDVLDNLKVQWAYQMIGGKPQKRRVLRVLEFNGEALADPLDDNSLSAILGNVSSFIAKDSDQGILFKD